MLDQRRPCPTSAASISPSEISANRDPYVSLRALAFTAAALASCGRRTANRDDASPVRSTLRRAAASGASMGSVPVASDEVSTGIR